MVTQIYAAFGDGPYKAINPENETKLSVFESDLKEKEQYANKV